MENRKQHRVCYHLVSFCIIVIVIYAISMKFYSIFVCPYPKEFREMNMIEFASRFSQGQNPYSSALLNQNEPVITSVYGFLVPLILSFFIRLASILHISASPMLICEVGTLTIEVIATLFFFLVLNKKLKNRSLALFGVVLFYSCFWRYSACGGAFPDQWGMLCSVLLIFILNRDEQSNRYHPFLYVILLLCGFYVKQYFVFTTAGLLGYLFFKSKRIFIKTLIYGIILGGISIVVVHLLFPLYFPEVLPIAQGTTKVSDFLYPIKQIILLTVKHYTAITLAAFCMVGYLMIQLIRKKKNGIPGILNFEDGSVSPSYELCQVVITLFPLLYIAQNNGTIFTYFLQLWYPYVIICGVLAIAYINQVLEDRFQNKSAVLLLKNSTLVILIAISLFQARAFYIIQPMTDERLENWDKAYSLLDTYKEKGELLVSPHLSGYMLQNELYTSDFGPEEYNNSENLAQFEQSKLWKTLLPDARNILLQSINYNQEILDKVHNKKYACIAITDLANYNLNAEHIKLSGYRELATIDLYTGDWKWETWFYVIE